MDSVISSNESVCATARSSNLPWLPLAPKVWVMLVKTHPRSGAFTVIVRAEEGSVLPRHRHVESSELFIIRGAGLHPQAGHYTQGDFVTEPAGSFHDPIVFNVETELLMRSNGASIFLDDEGNVTSIMDLQMLQQFGETKA
ncbi:hypothetical protein BS50DRAFT_674182 [Corynespora cassiicola Philippines]|uniref:ChrR-like cupin domain-containing protein n=1 Tax=Corynespora cassiicola Philippines TaxID=1448308 RepID=A0A2T2NW38_CORCC|nr:hypothetical protein BS50DRAFT_674182 [Corynespora cassiicola Philippines]